MRLEYSRTTSRLLNWVLVYSLIRLACNKEICARRHTGRLLLALVLMLLMEKIMTQILADLRWQPTSIIQCRYICFCVCVCVFVTHSRSSRRPRCAVRSVPPRSSPAGRAAGSAPRFPAAARGGRSSPSWSCRRRPAKHMWTRGAVRGKYTDKQGLFGVEGGWGVKWSAAVRAAPLLPALQARAR